MTAVSSDSGFGLAASRPQLRTDDTMPKKFCVIWRGRKTGVSASWDECSVQITGYLDAESKAFPICEAAEEVFCSQKALLIVPRWPRTARPQD